MSDFAKNPQYKPVTFEQRLGYLVEECGEVMAAAGKTLRWGLESHNPELPDDERETNRDWLARELRDLKEAIALLEGTLTCKRRADRDRVHGARSRPPARPLGPGQGHEPDFEPDEHGPY